MHILPYPQRADEIKRFTRKHHYTRRCPGVWTIAYAITNASDRIQAVAMYGPAPYPTVARAFCRRQEDTPRHIWQHRMVGQGITGKQLDSLISFANCDLERRGYWWIHTLTDPTEHVITGGILRLEARGYTGEVYHRTGAAFLGSAGSRSISGFLIDGKPFHIRQGAVTLTLNNVHDLYPDSHIRVLKSGKKERWAYVLGNAAERAERTLLMAYHAQVWQPIRQPRLLHNWKGLIPVCP